MIERPNKRSLDRISLVKIFSQEWVLAITVSKNLGTTSPSIFWGDVKDLLEALRTLPFVDNPGNEHSLGSTNSLLD